MRAPAALALALLATSPAIAQAPGKSEITAKNVKCGLLTSKPAAGLSAISPTGPANKARGFRIEETTSEIPARRGVVFGITYTLKNFLGTGTTPIRVVFTFPEPGLRNPATGKTSLFSETTARKKYDDDQMDAYTLTEDWQLVPGKWLVQVFDGQKKLAECAFKIGKAGEKSMQPAAPKP